MLVHDTHGTLCTDKVALFYGTCVGEVDDLTEAAFDTQGQVHDIHVTFDVGEVALFHDKGVDEVDGLTEMHMANYKHALLGIELGVTDEIPYLFVSLILLSFLTLLFYYGDILIKSISSKKISVIDTRCVDIFKIVLSW